MVPPSIQNLDIDAFKFLIPGILFHAIAKSRLAIDQCARLNAASFQVSDVDKVVTVAASAAVSDDKPKTASFAFGPEKLQDSEMSFTRIHL
jgi:hypothetical protein